MPRLITPGGGGLTSPVGIADGGTGATSRAAALAALYGWTAPPTTGWTSFGSPSVNGLASDGRSYAVGKALSGTDEIHGVHRAIAAGAFRAEAWICTDAPLQYTMHGICALDADDRIAVLGRATEPGLSRIAPYATGATSASLTPGTRSAMTWATYGGTGPTSGWDLGQSAVYGFAIERAAGGGITWQLRQLGAPEWMTYGTLANETTAMGSGFTGITKIGFFGSEYDAANIARGRVHRTYLLGWSVT